MIRTHWPILLLALLVASLAAFPQLIAQQHMGEAYLGVPPVIVDDELYYLARAHETLDGHPTLGNPYLWEHKEKPGVQFWIPDMVLAQASVLLGGLPVGAIVWDFIFPFLVVLTSYGILFLLTRDRLLSVATTALAIPGLAFVEFLRTPHPQLFVLVLAAAYAILKALEHKSWRWGIAAALLGGSLFYVYPFYWTYFVVMVGIAIPATFVLVRQTHAYRMLLSILVAAVALGAGYFIEMLGATKVPEYAESLRRIGVIETHFPSGLYIVFIVSITGVIMAWCWWKRIIPHTPQMVFIASTALAGAVVTNQHIVTGMNFFFTVHYTMFAEFMCVFAVGACVPFLIRHYIPETYRQGVRVGVALALVLFAIISIVPQAVRFATPKESDIAAQRYAPILAWLDTNTRVDDVVYANPTLSLYVPAYTHNNVFFATYAQQAYLSQQEVSSRYLGARYFDEVTEESIKESQFEVFGAYYVGRWQHSITTNRLRALLGAPLHVVEQYPEADIAALVEESTHMKQKKFLDALGGFRVDYVVWDSVRDPNWKIPQNMEEVYVSHGLSIYAMP